MTRYYLDANATTALDPAVQAVMAELAPQVAGNPSSLHAEGRRARAEIDLARDQVAAWLGGKPSEIIFTSGGTESCNLAVQGLAWAAGPAKRHIVTATTEHQAVLQAVGSLERQHGFTATYLPVDRLGRIDPADLRRALRPETALVSIMTVNNETGVRQPIGELAELCAERRIFFHTDAVQSAGKEPLGVGNLALTALSLAAHKFHGPAGAGVLWLRNGVPLRRLQEGGAQENERRPGTENTLAIAGLAEAVRRRGTPDSREQARQRTWIETLWAELAPLGGIRRNGDPVHRCANTLNVSLDGLAGDELLIGLDLAGLAVSSGSACLVGAVQPSHVLTAMGIPAAEAGATVRIAIDAQIRDDALPEIASRFRTVVERQRRARSHPLSPLSPTRAPQVLSGVAQ